MPQNNIRGRTCALLRSPLHNYNPMTPLASSLHTYTQQRAQTESNGKSGSGGLPDDEGDVGSEEEYGNQPQHEFHAEVPAAHLVDFAVGHVCLVLHVFSLLRPTVTRSMLRSITPFCLSSSLAVASLVFIASWAVRLAFLSFSLPAIIPAFISAIWVTEERR